MKAANRAPAGAGMLPLGPAAGQCGRLSRWTQAKQRHSRYPSATEETRVSENKGHRPTEAVSRAGSRKPPPNFPSRVAPGRGGRPRRAEKAAHQEPKDQGLRRVSARVGRAARHSERPAPVDRQSPKQGGARQPNAFFFHRRRPSLATRAARAPAEPAVEGGSAGARGGLATGTRLYDVRQSRRRPSHRHDSSRRQKPGPTPRQGGRGENHNTPGRSTQPSGPMHEQVPSGMEAGEGIATACKGAARGGPNRGTLSWAAEHTQIVPLDGGKPAHLTTRPCRRASKHIAPSGTPPRPKQPAVVEVVPGGTPLPAPAPKPGRGSRSSKASFDMGDEKFARRDRRQQKKA